MKKNKSKKLKIFSVVLVIFLFVGVGVFLRERDLFNKSLTEKVFEIVPTVETNSGISLKFVDVFENENGEIEKTLTVKPGQVIERVLLVKNHYKTQQQASFVLFDSFDKFVDGSVQIEFSEQSPFLLKPSEWKLISVIIKIPDDYKPGDAFGKIAVRNQNEFKYNENINIAYAVAVEMGLFVTNEEVPTYNYRSFVEKKMTTKGLAMEYVYSDLKTVVSVLFGVLSLVFLYLAFTMKKS